MNNNIANDINIANNHNQNNNFEEYPNNLMNS